MKNVYAIITILSLFSLSLRGQGSTSDSSTTVERTAPTLAFGVGTLSYFGELNTQNKLNSPLTSRMAFNFAFRQDINYYLEFELDFWTGITSANERTLDRNLNFETQMYGFGLGVNYNFANFLKEDHFIEPVIGVGVEVIGFSAKTDLYDKNGIRYNYWSDGSIRNLPESDPNAEKSVLIQRDYYYESDIKTDDFYNLDNHNSYGIGIPITVGVNMLLNDKWTFRAAMIYHFTTIDLMDGMDENSGNFAGDAKTDRLIYSTVSIAYNFTNTKPPKEDDAYEDFTPFLLDQDEDNDSINDFEDDCLITPPGVKVDSRGCPLDGDKDGVPDYKDQEMYSAANAQVDSLGVTITDEVRDLYYVRYYDETGNYSPIDAETSTMQVVANKVQRRGKVYDKTYAVSIGEFTGDIPADLMNQILSLPDVNTYDQDGTIIIAVGRYTTVSAAISRKNSLLKNGISNTEVIVIDKEYNVTKLEASEASYEEQEWEGNVAESSGTVYRIQIGAFSKKADESKFANLPNVISLTSDDGITRYYTGLYTDYNEAAKAKIDLIVNNGMDGIFIVSFKDGKTKAYMNKTSSSTKDAATAPLTDEQKKSIKFRVQLGSFKRQIPTDELEHYMELGNIKQFKGNDRYIRYTAGEFDSYKEASDYKNQLRSQGYKGCYVVGEYNGKLIPAKKAKEMRNN